MFTRRIPSAVQVVYTRESQQCTNQMVVAFHVDEYHYVGMNEEEEKRYEEETQQHLCSKVGELCREHLGVEDQADTAESGGT